MDRCRLKAALPLLAVLVSLLACQSSCIAANPPLCPHVIGWNNEIGSWAQGAPWIKVIFASDIAPAKATGAKVFYRPFTADTVYWENGYLPTQRTGATYADLVWAQIANLPNKPDAVSYRNEFDWSNTTQAKRTCAEFVNYKSRLRELGYSGKVIFGSFGPDWVSAATWQDPDLMAAVNASDGVETHEYFDFEVTCCLPNRCFRHRDIAIANNAYLQGKDWYIGEFGSDVDWGPCKYCGDGTYRTGWRDRGKLTEQQYIDQMNIYRTGCANQVVAVFVFQQGDQTSWSNYEVVGTSVATYMRTTWAPPPPPPGRLIGQVKATNGTCISGATITASPGDHSALTLSSGSYAFSVPPGTYRLTVNKTGYGPQSASGRVVTSNVNTVTHFTLYPLVTISEAKRLPDAASTSVSGVVTARFPATAAQDTIYIEDEDRTCGIRVAWSETVDVGDKISLSGTLATSTDSERFIAATAVVTDGTAEVKPLLIVSRNLGGGEISDSTGGTRQSAIKAWRWTRTADNRPVRTFSEIDSLNNLGLLFKATGKVTLAADGYFYLDDGSGWDDFETPNSANGMPSGLRVALPEGTQAPPVGSRVIVEGISSCYRSGTVALRLLRVSRSEDIIVAGQ